MACKNHPKYKGAREPRAWCAACWHIYAERHPEYHQLYAQQISASGEPLAPSVPIYPVPRRRRIRASS
jgi:hypothetical protein